MWEDCSNQWIPMDFQFSFRKVTSVQSLAMFIQPSHHESATEQQQAIRKLCHTNITIFNILW